MNDSTELEQKVRNALHDAGEHAPLAEARVPHARSHTRSRALVAACVVALGITVTAGAIVATNDDGGIRVATQAGEAREIPVAELSRADSDLFVYFQLDASDEQIADVRALLDASPDVERYAFLDHDAAHREFAELFACNPELVDAVPPAELPVSFRVATVDDVDAVARLQVALEHAPGVHVVGPDTNTYGIPASSDTPPDHDLMCRNDAEFAQPGPFATPPSTVPPTLPPPGDPPIDPNSAHDAVVAAFTQAWDGTSTVEQRRAAMQGSEQLAPELDRARTGNETTVASMHAVIGDVTFVAPDRAAVVFHLEFATGLVQPTMLGYAVLEDGIWKVSRETVCAVLSGAAGVSCPAG